MLACGPTVVAADAYLLVVDIDIHQPALGYIEAVSLYLLIALVEVNIQVVVSAETK